MLAWNLSVLTIAASDTKLRAENENFEDELDSKFR